MSKRSALAIVLTVSLILNVFFVIRLYRGNTDADGILRPMSTSLEDTSALLAQLIALDEIDSSQVATPLVMIARNHTFVKLAIQNGHLPSRDLDQDFDTTIRALQSIIMSPHTLIGSEKRQLLHAKMIVDQALKEISK